MIPPLQSWLYLGGESWLYSWQQQIEFFQLGSYGPEQHLGIGWITLLLAVVGFWRFQKVRGPWAQVTALCAIATILLVVRYPGGFMPWKYVFGVIPGATAIRAVSRVVLLMLIPFSIGLAYLAQTTSRSAAVLIAAICFFEQGQDMVAYDKIELRRDADLLAAQVNKECATFYYSPFYSGSAPDLPPQYKLQIDAMWASLQTGVPTINGYGGGYPEEWGELLENKLLDEAGRLQMRDAIGRWVRRHRLDPAKVCWIQ
jgi:hypothetical protein